MTRGHRDRKKPRTTLTPHVKAKKMMKEQRIMDKFERIHEIIQEQKAKLAPKSKRCDDVNLSEHDIQLPFGDAAIGDYFESDILTKTEDFSGGAKRETVDYRFDLMSPEAQLRKAKTFYEGALKYGERNWEQGIPFSNLINHVFAHLYAYVAGDNTEDHLAHASWGIDAMIHFEKYMPEMNDLPCREMEIVDYEAKEPLWNATI